MVSVEKELKVVSREEEALHKAAMKQEVPKWKASLTEKVPEKVYGNLQKAFCKAFEIIFQKGTGIIEKTYDRDSIQEDHEIRKFAFQVKGDRKALKRCRKDVWHTNMRNTLITSVEGFCLGVLGIGLPDIAVFVGVLLKGIYEMTLRYGFDYDSKEERYFILKLMETAMQKGSAWEACNREVDRFILEEAKEGRRAKSAEGQGFGTENWTELADEQISRTANAFAMDMVLLKFIQGLPVVGVVGGAGNPLYYNKVMKYAELKYRKRYLLGLKEGMSLRSEGSIR